MVFAKGGVEYIIEKPDAFSRNLLFILYFLTLSRKVCKLKS